MEAKTLTPAQATAFIRGVIPTLGEPATDVFPFADSRLFFEVGRRPFEVSRGLLRYKITRYGFSWWPNERM
jgi:hypothetical protein